MQRILIFLAVFPLFYGCKDCPPISGTIYQTKVLVYNYDSMVQGRLVVFDDTLATLTSQNPLIDPLYSEQLISTAPLLLPLSNQSSTVTFDFSWKKRSPSSMTLGYRRIPTPVPPDCGIYDVYEGLEVVQHSFDSIAIVKPSLELNDELHIQAFLRQE